MTTYLRVVLAFLVGLGMASFRNMASDEIRDRLDHLPHAILRLAAHRFDRRQRVILYQGAWLPELTEIVKGAEARPITRLIIGTRYALSILVRARLAGALALARLTPQGAGKKAAQIAVLRALPRSKRRVLLVSSRLSTWSEDKIASGLGISRQAVRSTSLGDMPAIEILRS